MPQMSPTTSVMAVPQFVYIRIRRDPLLQIPTDGADLFDGADLPDGADSPSTVHLYLIKDAFEDVRRCAGATVYWVIKVAHLTCNTLRHDQVYTRAVVPA